MARVGNIDMPLDDIAAICRRYQVRELAVFGSALRDDFRNDSDIDILVEFDPEARFGLFTFFALRKELSDLLGRSVDLGEKRSLKPAIRDNVLTTLRVVYADRAAVS